MVPICYVLMNNQRRRSIKIIKLLGEGTPWYQIAVIRGSFRVMVLKECRSKVGFKLNCPGGSRRK